MNSKNINHNWKQVKENLDEIKNIIVEEGEEYKNSAKEKLQDTSQGITTYIQENPIKSVGIAAISGIVLAKLAEFKK